MSSCVAMLLVYVFYSTEMREKLENITFDWRTVLQPPPSHLPVTAVLNLDVPEGKDASDVAWTPQEIAQIVVKLDRAHPRSIVLVLPHQYSSYENTSLSPLLAIMMTRPHVYLGLFDVHEEEPTEKLLPTLFEPFAHQVGSVRTFRHFRQEVVRSLPLFSYLGNVRKPQLLTQVAIGVDEELKGTLKDSSYSVIHYRRPDDFIHLSVSPRSLMPDLRVFHDKHVIVGYSHFLPRDVRYRDGTLVNTPFEGEDNPERQGSPLTVVMANHLDNLLQRTFLSEVPLWVNGIQSTVMGLSSYFIFLLPSTLSVLFYLAFMLVFFMVQTFVFSYFYVWVPLADTMMFSFFAVLLATYQKSRSTYQKRVKRQEALAIQEDINRVQSQFLYRFAFELRSRNQRIESLLRPSLAQTQSPAIETTLKRAYESCGELDQYLSGIVQYSLLGEMSCLQTQAISCVDLLRRIVNSFEHLIRDQELTVTTLVQQGSFLIQSDPIFLEPILFNLISNAIRYSPRGGSVKISVRHHAQSFLFETRDEGCGIPPEEQEKIFEKFYRIDNDARHRIKGNGLGLYLALYFARAMGASISLTSVVGKGSCFCLSVPL